MSIVQRLVLLGAVADGFRVKPKRRNSGRVQAAAAASPEEEPLPPPLRGVNPGNYPSCHMGSSSCSLRNLGNATLVYPGKSTSKCWNGDEWAFMVQPGASDKLMFYFPGGGACWERPSVFLPGAAKLCTDSLEAGLGTTAYGVGAQDFSNPQNPFKDYTVVSPTYCGGGAHAANTTVRTLLGTTTRYQYDYLNADDARQWVLANMDSHLTSFVISGSSAGSLGAAVWADRLLSTISFSKASVLLDSYVGVFPEDTQGRLMYNYGVCSTSNFQNFRSACEGKTVELEDLLEATIQKYPKVAFGHLQAKTDLIQRLFFSAVGLSFFGSEPVITSGGFYRRSNEIKQKMNRFPNYVTYLVDGAAHVFMTYDSWYNTTVSGQDQPGPAGIPKMTDWVRSFIAHDSVSSQCKGSLQENGHGGSDYCDRALFPKTLRV